MKKCDVSIIITLFNAVDYTRQMMQYLPDSIKECNYELIFVDNASTDETPQFLASLNRKVITHRNEVNENFSGGCNKGASMANGKYLVFLNNDTILIPGWLDELVNLANTDESIGIIGNKQLYPGSNVINHAGVFFDETRLPTHYLVGADRYDPRASIIRDFQAVTAACLLIEKDLFYAVGGFDTAYRNGFEDTDLCFKVKKAGKRIVYCPTSEIFHYGQKSPGRKTNDEYNENQFLNNWGEFVTPDHVALSMYDRNIIAKQVPQKKPTAIKKPIVVNYPNLKHLKIHLENDFSNYTSFSWLTAEFALALQKIKVPISISPSSFDQSFDLETQQKLTALQLPGNESDVQVRWTHYWPKYFKQKLNGRMNGEFFAINYLFTHQRPDDFDYWMQDIRGNGHYKLPISNFCRDALLQLGIPKEMCQVVPLGYSPEALLPAEPYPLKTDKKVKLLAIINSADIIRMGTDILLKAYSQYFTKNDDVVLVIKDYGKETSPFIRNWMKANKNGPEFILINDFLSKKDLMNLYSSSTALIAPYRGEGFAVKILDGMACGLAPILPLFGGPIDYAKPEFVYPIDYTIVPMENCLDTQSIKIGNIPYWCEAKPYSLIEQIRNVIADPDEAIQRGKKAREFVLNNYSWEQAAEKLVSAFVYWQKTPQKVIKKSNPQPIISVIIPTFNRLNELKICLDHLEKQSFAKDSFEVIVVNDGSNDGTKDWLTEYTTAPFTIKIFNQANAGPAAARNNGIRNAKGKIIVIIGDDIYVNPNYLEYQLSFHQDHPALTDAVLGLTSWAQNSPHTAFMDFVVSPSGGMQFSYWNIKDPENIGPGFFFTSNISLKRDFLLNEPSLFNETFWYPAWEDIEFGYRLSKHGMRLHYRPELLAFHDHSTDIQRFCQRQFRAGQMAWLFIREHPESTASGINIFDLFMQLNSDLSLVLNREEDKRLLKIITEIEKISIDEIEEDDPGGFDTHLSLRGTLNNLYGQMLGRAYILGLVTGPETRVVWEQANSYNHSFLEIIRIYVSNKLHGVSVPSITEIARAWKIALGVRSTKNIVLELGDKTYPLVVQATLAFLFDAYYSHKNYEIAGRYLSALEILNATQYSELAHSIHENVKEYEILLQANKSSEAVGILLAALKRVPMNGYILKRLSELLLSMEYFEQYNDFRKQAEKAGMPLGNGSQSGIHQESRFDSSKTLSLLFESTDIQYSLKLYEDRLDNNVLKLVYENAAMAKQDGEFELYDGLVSLGDYIEDILRTRIEKVTS